MKLLKSIILITLIGISFSFKNHLSHNDMIKKVSGGCITIYYTSGASNAQKTLAKEWIERSTEIRLIKIIEKYPNREKWVYEGFIDVTKGNNAADMEDGGYEDGRLYIEAIVQGNCTPRVPKTSITD